MSMYSKGGELKQEFEKLWPENGTVVPARLTYRQMWFIVKVAKGARLYCRSNKAFNNFFNMIFGSVAEFSQITKVKPGGDTYEGLQIVIKNLDGTEYADNTIEEGE